MKHVATCGKCALSIVHTMHCLDHLLIFNIELIIINNNLTLIFDVRKLTIIVPDKEINNDIMWVFEATSFKRWVLNQEMVICS